ncbi:NADH dehydrogenase [ubiquinone] iron-sulfur protein 8, mitochondrial isoform X3 [Diceros bicornis minor]|uniref:NADH dehydrogenase [ubiquinone] iron-sulfur protein 8, mitochondrial isoform X3 n=1 Tax=Diceros bicornis minor TaxID=77932 RepID=UPI0026EAFE9C|nr:NADH dehydrogenase [ubiquinone] iron-sulfur protein 8, mitochondrial isoform X3 [Diceros bicornis minor]
MLGKECDLEDFQQGRAGNMHCLTTPTLLRALAQAARAGHPSGRNLHGSAVAATYKYVNVREPTMDMKSVTDRAAQTLLWTELIRGHHHRGRAEGGRQPPDHALRHRHDQVHLLRLLPGGLPRGRHRRGPQLRVLHGDTRGAAVQQGEAAQQRGQVGGRDHRQHPGRLPLPVTPRPPCAAPLPNKKF